MRLISVFLWSFLLILVGMGHMLFWRPPEVYFPRFMVYFGFVADTLIRVS